MNEQQLHKIVQRFTATDDLQQLIKRQEMVKDLINLLNNSLVEDAEDLQSYLSSSALFTQEDLSDEVSEVSGKEHLLSQLTFLNVRLATQQKLVKEKNLRKILGEKGYKTESRWDDFGLHIEISIKNGVRGVLVLSQEVIADCTPDELLSRLERYHWQEMVAANNGKALYFTNNGFR